MQALMQLACLAIRNTAKSLLPTMGSREKLNKKKERVG